MPLSILDEADIKSMIAMAKPRVDTSSLGSLYDKIQLVVDTAGALAEGRMLVMLHKLNIVIMANYFICIENY